MKNSSTEQYTAAALQKARLMEVLEGAEQINRCLTKWDEIQEYVVTVIEGSGVVNRCVMRQGEMQQYLFTVTRKVKQTLSSFLSATANGMGMGQ